ncbi:MAG TPA: beta-ketoacyl synthase N-terminal-like domain-containing protein, partial [Urbifossiella sp.]|nr:beta-ketoacyl synthase N-terminal-like domain-containing protein [Urbifossiella sp.]
GRCSPFDAKADGLMVGEGAAIFVLKRLSDALAQGDTILAAIAGIGLSNDMHGNLLAPAKEGQLRAMRRAYKNAGWQPGEVDLIECHATGTPVGDAVEFDSLRELWGETGWRPGQCVIGSVKSTVGHLLTGAGAAATAKAIGALWAGVLPPQANFREPNPALRYESGPFRILGEAEAWESKQRPRRAAVSGFGFGGVNAHLLLEEWTGEVRTAKVSVRRPANVPVAVVGLAAHFGPWNDLRSFQERVFGSDAVPKPKENGWGLASELCPAGFLIDELHFPIDRFRIPPKELEETLPQQLLMLQTAAAALEDSSAELDSDDPNTGVYIGLGLDPNTTNYHLRWAASAITGNRVSNDIEPASPTPLPVGERPPSRASEMAGEGSCYTDSAPHPVCSLRSQTTLSPAGRGSENAASFDVIGYLTAKSRECADRASPALNANRVMGALGSIAASRIARAFHFGGPSHTVCSEEASAARALELAVRALGAGEIDRALVGGVDLAGDPRTILPGQVELPGEGAAAFVLKRLAEAERDGDRIYAVIAGVGTAGGGDPSGSMPSEQAVAEAVSRACADAAIDFSSLGYTDGIEACSVDADIGKCGAASSAAAFLKACLAVYQELLPSSRWDEGGEGSGRRAQPDLQECRATYWLHDRANGPRRAAVAAGGADGSCIALVIQEHANEAAAIDRIQPLGARTEALFAVEGASTGELAARLAALQELASNRHGNIEAIARQWFRHQPFDPRQKLAVAFVARSVDELGEQANFAAKLMRQREAAADSFNPAIRDRVFFSPMPLGPKAKIAFVFPGSGNQFEGMGRDLAGQWPELPRRQQAESERLRSQFAPQFFWNGRTAEAPPRDLMFGQVTVGSLVADLLGHLGIRCDAMIGLSLGESAGLFGIRAWRSRDEMFRRMQASPLFNSDLAPPYNAARLFWALGEKESANWVSGIIAAAADDVLPALRPGLRAYLLIANTPNESVIGGERSDVEKLAAAIGKPYFPLTGVTLAHCEVGRPVEHAYRELHTLPTTPPSDITVYSGAWGRSYKATDASAADSITAGLLNTIDVPAVVNAAYRDGVRVFLEVGPGTSCTRMIGAILGEKPHLARAAHAAKPDAVSQILRLAASLIAERVPVNLGALYGRETACIGHRERQAPSGPEIVIPVGMRPEPPPAVTDEPLVVAGSDSAVSLGLTAFPGVSLAPIIAATCDVQIATMQAQEAFLRVNQRMTETAAGLLRFQTALLGAIPGSALPSADSGSRLINDSVSRLNDVPRSLSFEQCCTFAVGKIADVLGPRFAEVDAFPTRVRLPDGPLQLVDRITLIEGEPRSLAPGRSTSGRVVTEHTVRPDRWYLENGRIPTALAVEAGQADLFLSGFLGIDFQTRGRAVYRLLDAVVSFHRGLPRVGEIIVYDIRIDEFTQQGDAWLFRFRFDGTVNGEPFITMRNGVAGFFTEAALAAGRGIVQTALDKQQLPGKLPTDWHVTAPREVRSLDANQVEALRRGDLEAAFLTLSPLGRGWSTSEASGPGEGLHIQDPSPGLRPPSPQRGEGKKPAVIPGGMLRLVDRVPRIDRDGGRFGIGFIRAEFDIRPDDWFLTCHFVDDRVMPGTLMYECCLHTLRIFLMSIGWVGEAVCEPIPGVPSRLKCRGQVIASTKTVAYEVMVKELGFNPAPYAIADALMYADDKPIVEITNLCLQMTGLQSPPVATGGLAKYQFDRAHILAFAEGKPSEAFGEPYLPFDNERVIARLPAPPFSFIDRITPTAGKPFVLEAGAACRAEYDIPPDAWYFEANRSERMPFSVLLEIALQPCGWLAAYCGSALTSPVDMRFRNLGGRATQFRPVTPDTGTLTMTAKMTNVSSSAGMIIQHYEMLVADRNGPVYEGTTYFGFFTKEQLANQVGIREAKVPWPSGQDVARGESGSLPHDPPFPAPMLRMVDRIETYLPEGGSKGLGLVVGRIAVDPQAWFFKAHFVQDSVWPGSLGLESFLQLLKYVAWRKGIEYRKSQPDESKPHAWTYRGQVLPTDREVTVILEVTEANERGLKANGFLIVDGRVIYQMTDFTLE